MGKKKICEDFPFVLCSSIESLALWLVGILSGFHQPENALKCTLCTLNAPSVPWWPNRLRFEDTQLQEAFFFWSFQLSAEFPCKAHLSSHLLLIFMLMLECTLLVVPVQDHRLACLWLERSHFHRRPETLSWLHHFYCLCSEGTSFLILFWGIKFLIMWVRV